jgi:hypothetical protein
VKQRARIAPLLAALALSALAHAITLGGVWLRLPQAPAEVTPLSVRLETAPRVATATTPVPRTRDTPQTPAPLAAAPAVMMTDAPAPWAMPSTVAEPAAEAETSATIAQPAPPPQSDPVVLANAAPSTFIPEPAITRTLPRRGRIEYNLNIYLSSLSTFVARTVQTWETAGENYELDSRTEPVGLAAWLSRHKLRAYHSSGLVTARGLLPRSFTSKVVVSGRVDNSAAVFDWDRRTIQFGRPNAQQSAILPAGGQDLLSFMFQLSLAPPPPGRAQIPITDGTNFGNRELDVYNEEVIETPVGNLRVLPVKQVRRPGSESIEVWLAVENHYLPVRIQYNNRDGTPGGELIVTAIRIE